MKTRTINRISTPVLITFALILFGTTIGTAAPGDLDRTFGVGGKVIDGSGYALFDVAIQPDGKIVAVGIALGGSEGTQIAVARYNIDGSPDTTFGGTGRVLIDRYGVAMDVSIQPDGKIVVASRNNDGKVNGELVRLNSDGSQDTSFGTDGVVQASMPSVPAILPDGKLLIAQFARLFRLNSNGSFDMTYGPCVPTGANFTLHYLYNRTESVIQPDGKILTAFTKADIEGINPIFIDFGAFRCNPNGTLDSTFGSGGTVITPIGGRDDIDVAQSVTIQTDGKIVVAGQSRTPSISNWKLTVVRYHPNGILDTGFGTGGIVITSAAIGPMISLDTVAIQTDGKIVASTTNENGDFALVRYNPNGSLDSTFGGGDGIATVDFNNSNDTASAMALDSQGRAVVVGRSDDRFAIARFLLTPASTPFDFDGDGKTDISIFRPVGTNGAEWWYQRSIDGLVPANQFGSATDKVVAADFTGDGKTDIAFFRPSTGQWFILRSEDGSFFAFPFGTNGDIPMPADYDGDGKADAAVFRPSSATWFILRSSDGQVTFTQFGANGDLPVASDYDGDGKADVAIFRPSGANGAEWWMQRSTAGLLALQFGSSTDKAVPGDYTGDGKSDIAFFRPSTGQWYILRSEDFSYFAFPFGAAGDVPVPGDYDGDGKTDAGIFRPSNATWFINRSTAGTLIQAFGLPTDQPVPSAYVR